MLEEVRITFRMPTGVHAFLSERAAANFTSINAEIVRAVRERMERTKPATGREFGDTIPAVGSTDTALQGDPEIHG